MADTVFAAPANAASVLAASPRLAGLSPGVLIAAVSLSLPGRPDHGVHFVWAATARAALTASHSLGETTATRLPLVTTSAVGNRWRSIAPAETSVEPSVAGRTIRACTIPGSRRSPTHWVSARTFSAMCGAGKDWPITVYFETGFIGGLPVTVIPIVFMMDVPCLFIMAAPPVTGIVRSSRCPWTSSLYETVRAPEPPLVTTPSTTVSEDAGTARFVAASPSSAW